MWTVGLYALSRLKSKLNTHSIGLYRDDGLGTLRRTSGSRADRTRKDLIKVFQELGLQITVQTNLKMVDYLDVTLNLATGSYQPYRKPNDTPLYIHTQSNHPPPIIKHIPVAVEKRIASLSSTEEIFNKAAPTYNEALKTSGYIWHTKQVSRKHSWTTKKQKKSGQESNLVQSPLRCKCEDKRRGAIHQVNHKALPCWTQAS